MRKVYANWRYAGSETLVKLRLAGNVISWYFSAVPLRRLWRVRLASRLAVYCQPLSYGMQCTPTCSPCCVTVSCYVIAAVAGLLLHRRLANMLACMVLGSNVHLLYVLQPDPLLTIYDWSCWHRLMNELSPPQQ